MVLAPQPPLALFPAQIHRNFSRKLIAPFYNFLDFTSVSDDEGERYEDVLNALSGRQHMKTSKLIAADAPGRDSGRISSAPQSIVNSVDIELFAGGGGMSIGLRRAGFSPACFLERDGIACDTLRGNIASGRPTIAGQVVEQDAGQFDWGSVVKPVRLLAAGAPCQPFSLAGKHLAEKDGRNLFPQVLRAVRSLNPQAVFLENVRGLRRHSFQPYFDYILRQLECPAILPEADELWQEHDERILKLRASKSYQPEYRVVSRVVDAADYGVPQNRHRVIVVALKMNLQAYEFPKPTHSEAALLQAMHSGTYWERHNFQKPQLDIKNPTNEEVNGSIPWQTVRDALSGLPKPAKDEQGAEMNHFAIPGARAYTGHTGSILDWPAKTIKAGVHGVPGGENTVIDDRGEFRYLTLRETARIQTFPDVHLFSGARIHVTRQIGNAVPCTLTEVLAKPLFDILHQRNRT